MDELEKLKIENKDLKMKNKIEMNLNIKYTKRILELENTISKIKGITEDENITKSQSIILINSLTTLD